MNERGVGRRVGVLCGAAAHCFCYIEISVCTYVFTWLLVVATFFCFVLRRTLNDIEERQRVVTWSIVGRKGVDYARKTHSAYAAVAKPNECNTYTYNTVHAICCRHATTLPRATVPLSDWAAVCMFVCIYVCATNVWRLGACSALLNSLAFCSFLHLHSHASLVFPFCCHSSCFVIVGDVFCFALFVVVHVTYMLLTHGIFAYKHTQVFT